MLNNQKILTIAETAAASNNTEHLETRAVVSCATVKLLEASASNHIQSREQVASIGINVASAVEKASEESKQQHEATRIEMERIRLEAEKQVSELREEIRLLKIEIEQSVQKVVAAVGKVSIKEQQRLKELSNAKFNLWVAKEIMLKKLLVSGRSRIESIHVTNRALRSSQSFQISSRGLGCCIRGFLLEVASLSQNEDVLKTGSSQQSNVE